MIFLKYCDDLKINIFVIENRWRLFGHILRRNSEIPANKSMNSYFISHGSKFRGRPLTTLPVVLNKDLTRVSDDTLQLTSLKDLDHLRSVAQNRQTWRKLTTRIREAAEASPSDDWDAEGPKSRQVNWRIISLQLRFCWKWIFLMNTFILLTHLNFHS